MIVRRFGMIILILSVFSGVLWASTEFVPQQIVIKFRETVDIRYEQGRYRTGDNEFDSVVNSIAIVKMEKPFSRALNFSQRDNIALVTLSSKEDLNRTIEKVKLISSVEWVNRNVVHKLEFSPNDSAFSSQYYLEQIRAPQAWDLAVSAEPVVIGFVDTGVDYTHPDLSPNMWINPGEDLSPIGVLTSGDYDGIDNDGNGLVDDLMGWDFVDTPELPYGEDYLTQDNDPMDTFGHGTAVAGIAGAVVNNSIGIAGAASNARIMALRCGSAGYLTEIAAAQAILYAVEPSPNDPLIEGAKVINLSFGSSEFSQLLQDVVEFAELQGVLTVASAGNEGSTAPHYPSGYDYTISVGGVNSFDQKMGISNYGASLDIAAPAQELLSTVPDGGYDYYFGGTGTSFAAPLVSACAAMVWGNNPGLSGQDVRSIVLNSADDLYSPGWDTLSGMGRLNMERAMQIDEPLTAIIMSPMNGNSYTIDSLQIKGSACGLYMQNSELYWGYGNNPTEWFPLQGYGQKQIVQEVLGLMIFDSTFTDGSYTIKLTVTDHFGNSIYNAVTFEHYSNPPTITVPEIIPAVEGNKYAYIFSYQTNQLCTSNLRFTGANPLTEIDFVYPAENHIYSINQDDLEAGIYNFQAIVSNTGGVSGYSDIFADTIILNQLPFNASYYGFKHSNVLPQGFILPKTFDLDNDGKVEVLLNKYNNNSFDSLFHYEYNNGVFIQGSAYLGNSIPQDVGDSDGDGLLETMTRAYGKTWIYEQTAPGVFPDNLIYYDSTDCYGSKLLDLWENDGHGEIFIRKNNSYQLYRHDSGDSFTLMSELEPSVMTAMGIPHSEWGDFNGDGEWDAAFGDGAGHLFIFTLNSSYQWNELLRDSLQFPDMKDYLGSGDFDGDGTDELIAGCHSDIVITEVGSQTSYWKFYIYDVAGGNLTRADSICFVGAWDPDIFDAGVSVFDSDGDGLDEIFLSLYPNLYQVEYYAGEYKVTWNYAQCRSNQVLFGDFDGNERIEITFNRGDNFATLEAPGGSGLPQTPMNFKAVPINYNTVDLSWEPVSGINFYQISRGTHPDSLQDIYPVSSGSTSSTNTGLTTNQIYYYAISTYSGGQYSPYSEIVSAIPNNRPEMLTQNFDLNDPFVLRLGFSEPMSPSIANPANFWATGGLGYPSSAILENDGKFVKLFFSKPFNSNLTYQLILEPVYDLQNTQLNNLGPFNLTAPMYPASLPYISKVYIVQQYVLLEFSQDMDKDSSVFIEKYSITYGNNGTIDIVSVMPDSFNAKIIRLGISPQTPIGYFGHIYKISATGLYSLNGLPLDAEHSSITITDTANNLVNVFTYPNPYRSGETIDGEECIMFANLTQTADIRIYNVYGELVKKLHSENTFGGIKWYLDNDEGAKVASGVYIYRVENGESEYLGKLAIMR